MNRPGPVEIAYGSLRFLLTHNPTTAQLGRFIEELKAYGVNTLVRVCAATYDKTPVEQEGIQVLDWSFEDGSAPPDQVVEDWLNLLRTTFNNNPGSCVAVHCVAGLGRAPVLVALALIECGMEYEDAVQFIRLRRRGAFNSKQLLYLEKYKAKLCLRSKALRPSRPAPEEITYDSVRFLLTHNPTTAQLGRFIEELKAYGVNTLVRVCAATYDKTPVEQEGIQVLDWSFEDGSAPPDQVVEDWLNLLQTTFNNNPGSCVAVHCVAGVGRAPVLVALGLIECGMEYEDAVHFIRLNRHGAFNSKQLLYLENYKAKLCLRSKGPSRESWVIFKKPWFKRFNT